MVYEGEFSTVWDGGVEVVCSCEVDLDDMKILSLGEDRWLDGNCDGYSIDTVDDEVEVLLEEYVYVPETDMKYSACAEYAYEQWPDDFSDDYGHGIIFYDDTVK